MTEGERSDGVPNMTTNTRALPMMDNNIKGELRMQFGITTVSKPVLCLADELLE